MKLNGNRVRELLKEKNMSQSELARKAGISAEKFGHYIQQANNCPKKRIMEFADILDVDWTEIVQFVGSFY